MTMYLKMSTLAAGLWCLVWAPVAQAGLPSQAERDKQISFCPKPPVYKTTPIGLYKTIYKSIKSLGGGRTSTLLLSKAFVRLWRISRGGGKQSRHRKFRRHIRKAIRDLKKKPNEAFVFAHPRRLMFYGLIRLKDRAMLKLERQCLAHDTYRVFSFVPGSFRINFPKQKPCRGVLFTELRRKIAFSELHYPVLTPFVRRTLMISGQRVDLFAWKTATPAAVEKIGDAPSFRFQLLKQRKKLGKIPPKQRAALLAKHKAMLDKEVAVIKKKMKDIKLVMGGYLLIYPHKGEPAYFGHLQFARLKGFLQKILQTSIGRHVLRGAVKANMTHVARP